MVITVLSWIMLLFSYFTLSWLIVLLAIVSIMVNDGG